MAPRQRQRLLLVGNGMAGMRTIDEILARDRERFDIEVIGAEPHPNYNRILLSSVLAAKLLDSPLPFAFWKGAVMVCAGSILCWIATRELRPEPVFE